MSIEWENKSWTWVNDRRCDECGFDASSTDPRDVADLARTNVGNWGHLLAGPADRLCIRPNPSTWSAIEYACHVRDVYDLLNYRFDRVQREDHPEFENWHPDERAAALGYVAERDPTAVLAQLTANAATVIEAVEAMTDGGWERLGTRADGVVFSSAWLSTYLIHDVIHHVTDVERGLSAIDAHRD